MTHDPEAHDMSGHEMATGLSDEQLATFEHGWAAVIAPIDSCWKVLYASSLTFEETPGTSFETLHEALSAIHEVLPAVNSPEGRARARRDRERRRSQ